MARSGGTPIRDAHDRIDDNTDFEQLLIGTKPYFLCNDITQLRASGNYQNSHATDEVPLPYNCTTVWPVRKTIERPPSANRKMQAPNWQDLIAYLCVDSEGTDVFINSDVWVGAAIADAMYGVLRPWIR
jgi:hypothetical protein